MNIDEAIYKEEALAYSFGERYKRLGEPVGDLQELEAEHRQIAEWLRELKAYKKVRRILSQNRIATDRYGDVVLWDDIKRVLKEVNADERR